MEKISCGGFYLGDNLSIENVDGKEILNSTGGGLPEVTGSGKALVSVNGEWVEQDGYGYTEGEFVTIEWDGSTEGKTKAQDVPQSVGYDFYKVSDIVVANKETIIGGVFFSDSGASLPITDENSQAYEGLISVADYVAFVSEENVESHIGTFPEKGVYFGKPNSFYVSKVQYGATVHKIDSKYIPESKELPDTPTQNGSYVLTCTISYGLSLIHI